MTLGRAEGNVHAGQGKRESSFCEQKEAKKLWQENMVENEIGNRNGIGKACIFARIRIKFLLLPEIRLVHAINEW